MAIKASTPSMRKPIPTGRAHIITAPSTPPWSKLPVAVPREALIGVFGHVQEEPGPPVGVRELPEPVDERRIGDMPNDRGVPPVLAPVRPADRVEHELR